MIALAAGMHSWFTLEFLSCSLVPGTKKDAGTAIWASKLSPGCPWGFRMVLYYMTQLAVSRGKNCILGFRMKPHWFHKKLHTPISLHCKISVFFKPLWFHQELEYAICETTLVSSKLGVCNKISAGDDFLAWWRPPVTHERKGRVAVSPVFP